jgi:hypothetical protein
MTERRRSDQNALREETGPAVKQDPRRDRSVPLWASALQEVMKEIGELKARVSELERSATREHAPPKTEESLRPTRQMRGVVAPGDDKK